MCCGNSSHWCGGSSSGRGCGCWCGGSGSGGVRCGCGWVGSQRRCGCSWPAPLWSTYDTAAVSADTVSSCGCDAAGAVAIDPAYAVSLPSFLNGCGYNG